MRYGGNPACVESRESVTDAPLDRERIALHRSRCPDCREHSSREEEIRRSLHLIGARALDDVARARIHARLASTFDRTAAELSSPRGRRFAQRPVWVAAAVAAALLLLWIWPRPALEPTPGEPRMLPFLASGTRTAALSATGAIEAGEGMSVRAVMEGQGEVTLYGPGRARLEAGGLVLEAGLVVIHASHPFEVRAGDVTVRVLGTRFAVDRLDPSQVRVSVGEGTVQVAERGVVEAITRGQSWPAGSLVEPRLAASQLAPPIDPSGVVVIDGSPPGSVALLDGAELGPTPLIARLAAGTHRLEVQAELHQPDQRTVEVAEGGVVQVAFTLEPVPAPPPRRVAPQPRRVKPAPVAPAETPETLYRSAEAALAEGRPPAARDALEGLVARFPTDPLAESALYELARLDHQDGRLEEAHARLVRLLERRQDVSLAESGQRLLCQIDVETRRYDDANACWRSFRERFPSSVHDAEALASLIGVAQVFSDCARVKALAAEFLARYPGDALRSDVDARLERCSD